MSEQPSVVDLLQQLVRIPSVNPSLVPSEPHGEAAVAAFACEWLKAHGVAAFIEDAAPARPNVVAMTGAGTGPTLVFCAHLDTVGTAGMAIPPFEPRIEGHRLFGRGTYDMKGSVAAIMVALATLAHKRLPARIVAALVADEEHASLGAFDFVRRHTADACILTEPSEGSLVLAHKGFAWAEIVTTGRAAHGSRWDLGVSAIAKMGRLITALEHFDQRELRRRTHPLVGSASLHCALIGGGTGLSTYAPECRLKIERRTLPGETKEQVERELRALVTQVDRAASIDVFFSRDPMTCDPGWPIVHAVREAVVDVTGQRPPDAGVGYWMDAAVFASAGIPTVNYGPSGAGAHEAVEWVDIPSVERLTHVLVRAAEKYSVS